MTQPERARSVRRERGTPPPLGERIRARRERNRERAEAAGQTAKTHAEKLRDGLKTHIDRELDKVRAAAKKYVDDRIEKLCRDNDLTPP